MTQQVVTGGELVKAFAIAGWREAEPGIAFDQVLELTAAAHGTADWMALDAFVELFGFDMVRHVKVTERPEC